MDKINIESQNKLDGNASIKIAECALCRTKVEIFIGCVCKPCYETKVLPFKKTTLKRIPPERDPNEDW